MRFSCAACHHWFTDDGIEYEWSDPKAQTGKCTFNPSWISTDSEHFCGQYAETQLIPGRENMERRFWDDVHKQKDAQQARAIKAEKALKIARAEIRTLRKPLTSDG